MQSFQSFGAAQAQAVHEGPRRRWTRSWNPYGVCGACLLVIWITIALILWISEINRNNYIIVCKCIYIYIHIRYQYIVVYRPNRKIPSVPGQAGAEFSRVRPYKAKESMTACCTVALRDLRWQRWSFMRRRAADHTFISDISLSWHFLGCAPFLNQDLHLEVCTTPLTSLHLSLSLSFFHEAGCLVMWYDEMWCGVMCDALWLLCWSVVNPVQVSVPFSAGSENHSKSLLPVAGSISLSLSLSLSLPFWSMSASIYLESFLS